MCRKEGVANHHHFNKTPFLNFFYERGRPPHPPALPIYPRGGDPSPPAHPERRHTTSGRERHTRPDAGHAAPVCTRYQTGRAGQIVTVRDAGGRGVCPKLCRYGHKSNAPKQAIFLSLFRVCLLPMQLYKYTKKCYYNVSKNIH